MKDRRSLTINAEQLMEFRALLGNIHITIRESNPRAVFELTFLEGYYNTLVELTFGKMPENYTFHGEDIELMNDILAFATKHLDPLRTKIAREVEICNGILTEARELIRRIVPHEYITEIHRA